MICISLKAKDGEQFLKYLNREFSTEKGKWEEGRKEEREGGKKEVKE